MHACRSWIQEVKEESANEVSVRQRVRTWVNQYAADILSPFGGAYNWNLPERSEALDVEKLRMDERRFTLDVALGLIQARIWDEPALMESVTKARDACKEVCMRKFIYKYSSYRLLFRNRGCVRVVIGLFVYLLGLGGFGVQMIPLHTALCVALTQSHLFDDEGTLMPFVFSAELATLAHARYRLGSSRFSAPRFPHVRIGDDFRAEVLSDAPASPSAAPRSSSGMAAASATAAAASATATGTTAAGAEAGVDASVAGALERMSAGCGGVPDEVVREAWVRVAPWMNVSIPDWWAFKVCYPTALQPSPDRHVH